MKYDEIKTGTLLWHKNQPGAFFVTFKSDGGAFVVDLMRNDNPMMVGLIMPRDSDEWLIDTQNSPLSASDRELVMKRVELWEMLNG